jgi:hypothetical protein
MIAKQGPYAMHECHYKCKINKVDGGGVDAEGRGSGGSVVVGP